MALAAGGEGEAQVGTGLPAGERAAGGVGEGELDDVGGDLAAGGDDQLQGLGGAAERAARVAAQQRAAEGGAVAVAEGGEEAEERVGARAAVEVGGRGAQVHPAGSSVPVAADGGARAAGVSGWAGGEGGGQRPGGHRPAAARAAGEVAR